MCRLTRRRKTRPSRPSTRSRKRREARPCSVHIEPHADIMPGLVKVRSSPRQRGPTCSWIPAFARMSGVFHATSRTASRCRNRASTRPHAHLSSSASRWGRRGGGRVVPRQQAPSPQRLGETELTFDRRTPSICALREVMEAGALISYGVNLVDVFRDVAALVDQVARLGHAGEIPMRAPSHFHTAFNLKTAKALGLQIPERLLALADEVIE